jgi:ASPIC and UnbV/FG-GAP-like repeat/PEP-CTERM motif
MRLLEMKYLKYIFCVISILAPTLASAQIAFSEVDGDFGDGGTFGASWGDSNGDGAPDLYVSRHANGYPYLFINTGDSTFDLTLTGSISDNHATAWADFDADGDQDFLSLTGASSGTGSIPNRFYVNEKFFFFEQAQNRGLDDPFGRGRTPLWLDWNNDGLLDVIISNIKRSDQKSPTAVFLQDSSGNFYLAPTQSLQWTIGGQYASVIHFADETTPSVFFDITYLAFRNTIFRMGETSPRTIVAPLPQTPQDHVFADLNGDLRMDVVVTQNQPDRSDLLQLSSTTIAASMLMSSLNPSRQGATFHSPQKLTISLDGIGRDKTHVGASGNNLPAQSSSVWILDPLDAVGISEPGAGEDGFYIGYDPTSGAWQFFTNSDSTWYQVQLQIDSGGPIDNLQNNGIVEYRPILNSALYLWNDVNQQFIDATPGSGLDTGSACQSVVAEDFDNDMDLDLYMTCTGGIKNEENRLFENMGNGLFVPVALAGGAAGTSSGRADVVVSADYDSDGRVDLFVTNGLGPWPFNAGVNQLFRNVTSNQNHWLEVDLEGVESNRDGIGALVAVTAGGVTQVRTRGGGMHRFAQNFGRLHFGLGASTVADSIVVHWPSGSVSDLSAIPANQRLTIVESDVPEPSTLCMALVSAGVLSILERRRSKTQRDR